MNGYKTYVGLIVALAPTVASLFGYTITPSFSDHFPQLVDNIVQVVGLLLAFYGRASATVPGFLVKQ